MFGSPRSWLLGPAKAAVLFISLVSIGGCDDQSGRVDGSVHDGALPDGAAPDVSADGLDGSVAVDALPDVTCREVLGGESATACDECLANETCAQFFNGFGEYWKIQCCELEPGTCSPDQCTSACDDLLCDPSVACICVGCDGIDPDPRAYPCCCP